MVKMEYTEEGGCQIPLLLAELPDPLASGDTTRADYECLVKWWEPEPQPRHAQNGTYDAKWRKWKERSGRNMVHAESEVKRERMALLSVRFTGEAELAVGFRKLNAATLAKISELPYARHDAFSSPASSSSEPARNEFAGRWAELTPPLKRVCTRTKRNGLCASFCRFSKPAYDSKPVRREANTAKARVAVGANLQGLLSPRAQRTGPPLARLALAQKKSMALARRAAARARSPSSEPSHPQRSHRYPHACARQGFK